MLCARLDYHCLLKLSVSPLKWSGGGRGGGGVVSGCHVVAPTKGYPLVCKLGVARLNSRGVGFFQEPFFVPDWILRVLVPGLIPPHSKLSVSLKCRGICV